jgi:hypothetical protein
MKAASAGAVWNGGVRTVPVGKEVAASCVRTPFCVLVSAQVSRSARFPNFLRSTTARSAYVSCQFLCLSFVANRWIKLGIYLKFVHYLAHAEPSRKTVKCTLLSPPFSENNSIKSDEIQFC